MPVPSLQWFQLIGLGCLVAAATAFPARAIEEVLIELPLLDSSFSVRVSELKSPQALMAGRSDLAELDVPPMGPSVRSCFSCCSGPSRCP